MTDYRGEVFVCKAGVADETTNCSVCERKGRGRKREGRERDGDGRNGRMEGWKEGQLRMKNGEWRRE